MNVLKNKIITENETKQKLINLNKECLSCSGKLNEKIVNLFKVACIDYHPNKILF